MSTYESYMPNRESVPNIWHRQKAAELICKLNTEGGSAREEIEIVSHFLLELVEDVKQSCKESIQSIKENI